MSIAACQMARRGFYTSSLRGAVDTHAIHPEQRGPRGRRQLRKSRVVSAPDACNQQRGEPATAVHTCGSADVSYPDGKVTLGTPDDSGELAVVLDTVEEEENEQSWDKDEPSNRVALVVEKLAGNTRQLAEWIQSAVVLQNAQENECTVHFVVDGANCALRPGESRVFSGRPSCAVSSIGVARREMPSMCSPAESTRSS